MHDLCVCFIIFSGTYFACARIARGSPYLRLYAATGYSIASGSLLLRWVRGCEFDADAEAVQQGGKEMAAAGVAHFTHKMAVNRFMRVATGGTEEQQDDEGDNTHQFTHPSFQERIQRLQPTE